MQVGDFEKALLKCCGFSCSARARSESEAAVKLSAINLP